MKTTTKEVYYCEHCKKHGLSKHMMARHELLCFKNPENKRPCFSCINLAKKQHDYLLGYNYNGSESRIDLELFFCNAKEIFLYTPQNEIKGNWYDLSNELNEPMPKSCDCYVEH